MVVIVGANGSPFPSHNHLQRPLTPPHAPDYALNADESPHYHSPPVSASGSPKRGHQDGLPRTQSEVAIRDGKTAESTTDVKSKYMSWFKLREQDGSYIQDVTEMTRVPIILKTDLSKSPP